MSNDIRGGCANSSIMRAVATDKLRLEALPNNARECYKFTDITLPLVSVPQLCDSDMDVHFTKTSVTVACTTGEMILEDHRDLLRNLYMVPIQLLVVKHTNIS